MKCQTEKCKSEQFYEISHGSTMLGGGFIGKIGEVWHNDDPNYHTRVYMCENGHRIEIYYKVCCPAKDCRFNKFAGLA